MRPARAGPGTLVPRPGSAARVRGADVVVREDRRARGAFNPAAPETPVGPGSSSWEAIVVEHSARVYRLAYRLTGNQHDAEDLTQESSSASSARSRPTRPGPSRAGCTGSRS